MSCSFCCLLELTLTGVYVSTKYRGQTPTGSYLSSFHKKFMKSIKPHLSKEVKKRGALRLSIDVSYKEAKKLCRVGGKAVYTGLVTAVNEYGEVRLQFHIVSDSHEQLMSAFEAFKKTTEAYGLPPLQLLSTDNPTRDSAMAKEVFPSLQEKQAALDNLSPDALTRPTIPVYPFNNKVVKVTTSNGQVNAAITAMTQVWRRKRIGLDCEWKVTRRGQRVISTDKIGCIQLSFEDGTTGKYWAILVFTACLGNKSKLPEALLSLFRDETITFAGVNIKGDLNRLSRDFDDVRAILERRAGANLVDLGEEAARRAVVPSRSVGLQKLLEVLFKKKLLKSSAALFSNWSTTSPTEPQIRSVLYVLPGSLLVLVVF